MQNIPSFEETRKAPAAGDTQPSHDGVMDIDGPAKEGLLIDFETPPQASNGAAENMSNPFDTFNATSAIRDEMAATKERDKQERRERERQSILEKREARRKSMGSYPITALKNDQH